MQIEIYYAKRNKLILRLSVDAAASSLSAAAASRGGSFNSNSEWKITSIHHTHMSGLPDDVKKHTGLINFLILINLKIYYYCKSLLYACMQHNFFFLNLFLAQSSMPIFMSPNNHVLKHSCLLCLLLHLLLLAMNKISFKVGSKIHKTVAYKYKKASDKVSLYYVLSIHPFTLDASCYPKRVLEKFPRLAPLNICEWKMNFKKRIKGKLIKKIEMWDLEM